MIRRVVALVFSLLFWSVQTADAVVPHVAMDMGSLAVSLDTDVGMSVVDAISSEQSEHDNGNKPFTCTDSCPCHVLHHMFFVASAVEIARVPVRPSFFYSDDARPDHIAAPLNRPPLA